VSSAYFTIIFIDPNAIKPPPPDPEPEDEEEAVEEPEPEPEPVDERYIPNQVPFFEPVPPEKLVILKIDEMVDKSLTEAWIYMMPQRRDFEDDVVKVSVAYLPNFIKFDEILKRLYIPDISSYNVIPGVYIVDVILDDPYG